MSETTGGAYGYVPEEEGIGSGGSDFEFGLNTPAYLSTFEYKTDAGQGGTEGEAIEIIFKVGESDKSYRKFPVTKAFLANNAGETDDPNHPAMKEAFKDWNAIMSHILGVFIDKEDIQKAFSVPIKSFKEYVGIAVGLLPKNFNEVPLDLFMQWQWQMTGENTTTFLEIPKKMKSGRWLMKQVTPSSEAGWKMIMKDNPKDSDNQALTFVDEAGNVHPFTRNGWFVNSNYAHRQTEATNSNISGRPANPSGTDSAPANKPAPSKW